MTPAEEQERLRYLRLKKKQAEAAAAAQAPAGGDIALPDDPEEPISALPARVSGDVGHGLSTHTIGRRASEASREERIAAGDESYAYAPGVTLMHGARQGGSLGFADELGGLEQAYLQYQAQFMPNLLGGQRDESGQLVPLRQVYRDARNGNRAEEAAIRKDRPGLYRGSEVVGAFAAPAPGISTLKGAIGLGAGLGMANGLGSTEADLTTGETAPLRVAGADMAFGGASGTLGGLFGYGLAKSVPPLLRASRSKLEDWGIAQGRRALLNGADSLSNKTAVSDDAVKAALEGGAIWKFGTTQGASKRLDALRDQYGEAYGALLSELEAQGVTGPRAHEVARELMARGQQEYATTGANKAVSKLYEREARNAVRMGEANGGERVFGAADLAHGGAAETEARLGLLQSEKIKRDLQAAASSEYRKMGGSKPLGEAKKEIAAIYRRANEEAVDAAGQAAPAYSDVRNLADAFVPVKRKMGNLIEAADAAERGATRTANRSAIGLPEKIAMASSLATGNPGQAIGAAAGGGLVRTLANRGASTAASTLYDLSRLAALGARQAARNPSALARATVLGAGALERERVSNAQQQVDPNSGLTPEEFGTLARWLQGLRGSR